jgi:hypothetical protein
MAKLRWEVYTNSVEINAMDKLITKPKEKEKTKVKMDNPVSWTVRKLKLFTVRFLLRT